MTDAELRALHFERLDCQRCREGEPLPHSPLNTIPSGYCRVCYEPMPCPILALLDRVERAEAPLRPNRSDDSIPWTRCEGSAVRNSSVTIWTRTASTARPARIVRPCAEDAAVAALRDALTKEMT